MRTFVAVTTALGLLALTIPMEVRAETPASKSIATPVAAVTKPGVKTSAGKTHFAKRHHGKRVASKTHRKSHLAAKNHRHHKAKGHHHARHVVKKIKRSA